jgi:hypothetical protein
MLFIDGARFPRILRLFRPSHLPEGEVHRVGPKFVSRPRNLIENPYKSLVVDPQIMGQPCEFRFRPRPPPVHFSDAMIMMTMMPMMAMLTMMTMMAMMAMMALHDVADLAAGRRRRRWELAAQPGPRRRARGRRPISKFERLQALAAPYSSEQDIPPTRVRSHCHSGVGPRRGARDFGGGGGALEGEPYFVAAGTSG